MDLECPYCENEIEICHDDGFGYQEGVKHSQECPHCNKSFVFETSIIVNYYPEKSDCLNDGSHNYKRTVTCPIEFSMMECVSCGHTRDMTEDERINFGIRTKEEFWESLK